MTHEWDKPALPPSAPLFGHVAEEPLQFDGKTYVPARDCARLTGQHQRVFDLMRDGLWRTLAQISEATGDPQASISARLRDYRKQRFGGHAVERRYVVGGLHQYRLLIDETGE